MLTLATEQQPVTSFAIAPIIVLSVRCSISKTNRDVMNDNVTVLCFVLTELAAEQQALQLCTVSASQNCHC